MRIRVIRWVVSLAAAGAVAGLGVMPASASTATSAAIMPVPAIPSSGGPYNFYNYDYAAGAITWTADVPGGQDAAPGELMLDTLVGSGFSQYDGDVIAVGAGTYQTFTDTSTDPHMCISYYNNSDSIQINNCNGATYEGWASENTSHGWLIWNEWFHNAYPGFCVGGYQAVVTVTGPNQNLYLACPEGGVAGTVWGEGQFWAPTKYTSGE